jgi:lipopolysaccharide/colanic/teichoic acid biosynthesis glycosyltransferase
LNEKPVGRAIKRGIDVAVSLVMLLLLVIPVAIIAVAIKLDSKGPVFFRQIRVGKGGKEFGILKFRTMVEGAEAMGTGIKTSRTDFRITRVGRWLRLFGLDELPQILNVLKGQMSLVGPRPTIPAQIEAYTPYQRQRLLMKPGITGLTILRGRNSLSWPERIQVDIEYIRRWSLWLDFRILLGTPWAVLISRRGVYRPMNNEL